MENFDKNSIKDFFKDSISAESNKELEDLKSEIEKIKDAETLKMEEEVRRKIDWKLGSVLKEIQNDHQIQLYNISSKLNSDLIKRRTELLEGLFSNVENRIKDFTMSKEYLVWLDNKLSKIKTNYQNDKLIFTVNELDKNIINAIVAHFDNPSIQKGNLRLFGFTVFVSDKNIIIDESLESIFLEQKTNFLNNCHLLIRKEDE